MASDELIEPVVRIGATFSQPSRVERAAKRGAAVGDVLLAIAIGLSLFGAVAHGLGVLG